MTYKVWKTQTIFQTLYVTCVKLRDIDIHTWCDVIFCEIITKCDDDLKKTLLYGLSKVEIGAIVGGTIGMVAFVPGAAVGAAVGAGIGAGIGALAEVAEKKIRKKRLAQQTKTSLLVSHM